MYWLSAFLLNITAVETPSVDHCLETTRALGRSSVQDRYPFTFALGSSRGIQSVSRWLTSRTFPFAGINALHRETQHWRHLPTYADRILGILGIRANIPEGERKRLNVKGPVIFVLNHGSGMLDPLIAYSLIHPFRPDLKVMTNEVAARVPDLRKITVPVDIMTRRQDAENSEEALQLENRQRTNNLGSMREILRHLKRGGVERSGGALLVAPAGEVAHTREPFGTVVESDWKDSIFELARASNATIVPIHVDIENSEVWNLLGHVSVPEWVRRKMPRLNGSFFRSMFLPSQVFSHRDAEVSVRTGAPIEIDWSLEPDISVLTKFMRLRTLQLKEGAPDEFQGNSFGRREKQKPIQESAGPEVLSQELAGLDASTHRLYAQDNLEVWVARGSEIPQILREIGIERLKAFREIDEGTTNSIDLDPYDDTYDFEQLFVWDKKDRSVIAGYRIGRIDENLKKFGRSGVYNAQFYKFAPGFLESLPPTFELGRSWVRASHQSKGVLPLLFYGIGELFSREPRYEGMLGGVSMSGRYDVSSREMVAAFFRNYFLDPRSSMVSGLQLDPGFSVRAEDLQSLGITDFSRLEDFVRKLDSSGAEIPPLFGAYSRFFGARLLGETFDPEFNSRDLLFFANVRSATRPDSPSVPRKWITRFMGGPERLSRYLSYLPTK